MADSLACEVSDVMWREVRSVIKSELSDSMMCQIGRVSDSVVQDILEI